MVSRRRGERPDRDLARYFIRPPDENPGLTCLGYGSKFERFDCGPRTWPYFGAVYVHTGHGRLRTAATSGDLTIGPGTLLWQFPGVEHLYGPDADGWHERWIVFDGPVVDSFLRLGFLDPANPVVPDVAHSPITQDLDAIEVAVLAGGPVAPLLAAAHIHHLIVAAFDRNTDAVDGERRVDPVIAAAIRRVEREAFTAIDVEAIARDSGLGYSTFRRRFKAATGTSPKSYVVSIRLARAMELLASSNAPIGEVARAVGFDDPYYFSRLFRAREGRSPSAFRTDHRRD